MTDHDTFDPCDALLFVFYALEDGDVPARTVAERCSLMMLSARLVQELYIAHGRIVADDLRGAAVLELERRHAAEQARLAHYQEQARLAQGLSNGPARFGPGRMGR